LPYTTAWYDKYKDQGLVVIGVHSPEFAFEHETPNVEDAVKRFNITYPVAQDNDFKTWLAFNNEYWPAEYLLDAKGIIRHTHFGEGEYDETEKTIQQLLKENGATVNADLPGYTQTQNEIEKRNLAPPANGNATYFEGFDPLNPDLAVPALEEFVLSLEPYPRRPGVEFTPKTGESDPPQSPFAVLKGLK
jgi:hypothetical protein